MKKIILLSMVLIIALLLSCAKNNIVTLSDREYKKITFDLSSDRLYYDREDYDVESYKFPSITCYDDVVIYGKDLFFSVYGFEQTSPYSICYNAENDCWMYHCQNIFADNKDIGYNNMLYAYISSEGDLLGVFPTLPKNYKFSGKLWNTSNAFAFDYDDFTDYSGTAVYNEKLDRVNCAEDVLSRALYLYEKWNMPNINNPYTISYDEKNDCWLYDDWVSSKSSATLTMVIRSDGEVVLADFVHNWF